MKSPNEDFDLQQIHLAKNIRNLRKRNGWSQEELASKVGLNRGNIASYEKGTAEPKICNLVKIAHCFGVSIMELTGKDLARNPASTSAPQKRPDLSAEEIEELKNYLLQFDELETVVESIYNCHCFALKQITEKEPELQTLTSHFQQMHKVTDALMKNHRSLLSFMKDRYLSQDPAQLNGRG